MLFKTYKLKQRLLLLPLLMTSLFLSGCKTQSQLPHNAINLRAHAVPRFPKSTPEAARELESVCPKGKCSHLYAWLGKLMIFDKQLDVFRENI